MVRRFSRRERRLVWTGSLAVVVLLGVTAMVVFSSRSEPPYRPGERLSGLTANLDRQLPQDYPQVRFVDVATEAGISFEHFYGKRSTQLPEDMGSGAAWADYDNDGWLDLFIVNQVGPLTLTSAQVERSPAHCALYHNNGDGTFTEVSAEAGVDLRVWGMAAAWGDIDNDGWSDLFVTTYGKNVFFHNNGDGTFSDRTQTAGLLAQPGFWTGASWADYDRDGFIDLYVCGYVKYSASVSSGKSVQYDTEVPANINPSSFPAERNLLYRNNGHGGFDEVARQAGVSDSNGRSLSAAWCDFNNDDWPDLYVANDVSDNVFLVNSGDGTFVESSHDAWVSDYRGAMGIAVGDWDGDADMDMFITHWIAQENALYNNLSSQFASVDAGRVSTVKFADEADRYGLGQIALDYIGWGTSFIDYDNDGRLDLFVVNGSTFQRPDQPELLQPMLPKLFWNSNRKDGFFDVSSVAGDVFEHEYVGRGAAFADYDNDGDVDVFVVQQGGPGLLLRNEGGNKQNWLELTLHGRQSNRSGFGTRVRLVTGTTVQIQEIGAQGSYCSQNSLVAHFGVGSHSKVDTLDIVWPGGLRQTFRDLDSNQIVSLVEGGNIQAKMTPRLKR